MTEKIQNSVPALQRKAVTILLGVFPTKKGNRGCEDEEEQLGGDIIPGQGNEPAEMSQPQVAQLSFLALSPPLLLSVCHPFP